jgi:hypothetical protein
MIGWAKIRTAIRLGIAGMAYYDVAMWLRVQSP